MDRSDPETLVMCAVDAWGRRCAVRLGLE